jgi:hypothetical protein
MSSSSSLADPSILPSVITDTSKRQSLPALAKSPTSSSRLSWDPSSFQSIIPEVDSTDARSARRLSARSRTYERTVRHIAQHLRIVVKIIDTNLQSESNTPFKEDEEFTVTVRTDQTIDQVARLIEAEYAFTVGLRAKDNPGEQYKPFVCGQLVLGNVTLRFEDKVGELLELNNVLHAVNVFEGTF